MSNYNWAFGFAPYEKVLRAHYYAVATAPTINVYKQDIVGASGVFTLTPKMGYVAGIYVAAVPDGLRNLLGSVLAIFDETFDPVSYIAAGDAGNSTIAGYVLVADDPQQFFYGREDFATNAIDLAEGSDNANIISQTLCAGDSNTGLSRQMIDSDTAATTAALNLKLYGPHPMDVSLVADDTPGSSADEGARYICQINEHFYSNVDATGGVSA